MLIKIDTRENALYNQIQTQINNVPCFKNIQINIETLPIGDIIINDGKEDKLIIERKSVNDLLSSIKDGRYEEQSYRLNGLECHNHNIIYLIEGDIHKINRFKPNNQIEKLTLYSAMFSLNYYKGFSVFRSFSLEESANILCNMAYKIEKETTKCKNPFYSNVLESKFIQQDNKEENEQTQEQEQEQCQEKNYVNVVKKVKKDNVTPENIGEIMLSQIPGISSVTSLAILEKYKTIPNLIKELQENGCITDLTYTNSKGQVRKISKTSLANVAKYLCVNIT